MTGASDTIRSLFLATLVVVSVLVVTVALPESATAGHETSDVDADAHLDSHSRYWGQTVYFEARPNHDYELRGYDRANEERQALYQMIRTDGDGVGTFTTDGLNGDFVVVNQDGDAVEFSNGTVASTGGPSESHFRVTAQTLEVEFADNFVYDVTEDAELTFHSNRDRYDVGVSVDTGRLGDLDAAQLSRIFENFDQRETDDLDAAQLSRIFENFDQRETDDNETIVLTDVRSKTYETNFTGIGDGNHTFQFSVAGTEATAADSIWVHHFDPGEASFDHYDLTDQVGDVVDLTVDVRHAYNGTATLVLGSADQDYRLLAHLTDGDDDGEVRLRFNTYTAGSPVPDSQKIWAADDDDEVTLVTESGDYTRNNRYPADKLLDTGEYEMLVSSLHRDDLEDYADDYRTLTLEERSTGRLRVRTAPAGADVDDWDRSDVEARKGTNLTRAEEIASGDYAVFQIDASGLEGLFESITDAGSNPTALNSDATAFEVERTDGGNKDGDAIDVSDSNAEFIADADNDTYYVVAPVEAQPNSDSRRQFEATFSVLGRDNFTGTGGYPVLNTNQRDESVSGTFDVVEPDSSLDVDDDSGMVLVEPAADQVITGQTNRAPGTEISITIVAADQTSLYLTRPDTRVQSDGTFNVTVDLGELDAGTNLSVTLENEDYDGRVVEDVEEGVDLNTDTQTRTETQTGTETQVETENPTPTEVTTQPVDTDTSTDEQTEPTGDSGPGFTVVAALGALISGVLLPVRCND